MNSNNVQKFQEGVRPEIDLDKPDSRPPFAIVGADEGCTLVLHASPPALSDFFSWEEVGELGVKIIQQCPASGGSARLGRSLRWSMMLLGGAPGREPQSDSRGFVLDSTGLSSEPVAISNNLSALHLSPPLATSAINCWPHDTEQPIRLDLAACREIYGVIRALPDYRTAQIFEEGVRPRLIATDPTSVPPFGFNPRSGRGHCTLVLQADEGPETEKFSWYQVVRAAEAISIQCADEGLGGFLLIGEDHKWILDLSAYERGLALGSGSGWSREWKGIELMSNEPAGAVGTA